MIKLVKKTAALLLVTAMAMTCFAGCGKNKDVAIDPTEVVMTVGDTEVTMDMANFFVRYNQSLMESVYTSYIGEDVWIQEVEDGKTYEENLKETLLEEFKNLYIVVAHAEDYRVALTDDEKAAIEKAVESFVKENEGKDSLDQVSASKEIVTEYLTLYTLNHKVGEAMRNDVNKEVTDEDAAQKRARYVVYEKETDNGDGTTTKLSDKEIKKAQKDAAAFLKGAKANGSMEAYATEKGTATKTLTFDKDNTSLDEKVIKAADKLKENEFSEVIETEDGIYVLQLESEFDKDATDAAKEGVLTKRQEARYEELLEKWTKDTKVTVKEEVWNKISVQGLKVVYEQDPEEEKEDEK